MSIIEISPTYNWQPAVPTFTATYPEMITSPQRSKPLKVGQLVWFWSFKEKTPKKVMVLKIDDSLVADNTFASSTGQEQVTILFNAQKKTVKRFDLSTSKVECVQESFWAWTNVADLFTKTINNNKLHHVTDLVSQTWTSDNIDLSYTFVAPTTVEQISFTFDMPATSYTTNTITTSTKTK